MKVLFTMPYFYPVFTGYGVFLRQLLQKLNERCIESNVLTDSFGGKYPSVEKTDNFNIYRIDIPFRNLSVRGYAKRFTNTFSWMIKNVELYDIVHLVGWTPNFLFASLLTKHLWSKKVVLETTLMGSDDPFSALSRKAMGIVSMRSVIKCIMLHIDHYTTISEPSRISSLKAGIPASKITKTSRMLDLERFRPVNDQDKMELREALGLPKKSFIVSFVGEIAYRKGVDILIESFEKVAKVVSGKPVFLVLIGPEDICVDGYGSNNALFVERIKKAIAESAYIRDKVLFTGLVDNVDEYLKSSDLFVFPSRREGLGKAILEAAACGLACIVSPLDGISKYDIFKGENEGIISELSSDSFADTMLSVIIDEEKRRLMGRNARKRVCQDFNFDIVVNRYIEVYKSICPGNVHFFL